MTLLNKLKLQITKKVIEWNIYDSDYLVNENKLNEIDKLIVLSEMKKIDNLEKMLIEFIDNTKNKYFLCAEDQKELRLMAKGLIGWPEFIVKEMKSAPLKLKQIADMAERNKYYGVFKKYF